MKYLGIDYGSKRIGIALSDDGGTMAFPRAVLSDVKNAVAEIEKIISDEGVGEIVIGSSFDASGNENPIMVDIKTFTASLSEKTNLPIHFQSEQFSSFEAARSPGKPTRSADARDDHFKSSGSVDASAAAIILQRYLDGLV